MTSSCELSDLDRKLEKQRAAPTGSRPKAEPPKRRGRPPGSKNKPKEAAPAEEPPEPAPATGAPAGARPQPPLATAAIAEDSAKEAWRPIERRRRSAIPDHPLHRPAPDQPVQP